MALTISLTACHNPTNNLNQNNKQIPKNENGKYISPDGKEYEYCLELTGTMPNAAKSLTWIVYTHDKDLTFEEVSKNLYSSYSEDRLDIYTDFVDI